MNAYLIAVLVFGVVLAGSNAGTYFYAVDHTENRIKADQQEQKDRTQEIIQQVAKDVGKEVAGKISGLRPIYKNITQETIREIREKTVYTNPDCAVPVTGVVQLNAARDGATVRAGPVNDAAAAKGTPPR